VFQSLKSGRGSAASKNVGKIRGKRKKNLTLWRKKAKNVQPRGKLIAKSDSYSRAWEEKEASNELLKG